MSEKLNIKDINFIDLFAGCGGLSEGFYKEGFNALAHVEIEPKACMSLRTRMKHYGYTDYDKSVLNVDITNEKIVEQIDSVVNGRIVHLIIGGPPCQAYSLYSAYCANQKIGKLKILSLELS